MSSEPTFDDWLTKQQAAQFLGVAEKTVDRMANNGEIQKATRKRAGKPPVVVFHPDDIGRARAARQQLPAPFVMPATSGTAVQQVSRTDVQPVSDFDVRRKADSHPGHVGHSVEPVSATLHPTWPDKIWLTEAEALDCTGLGLAALRARVTPEAIGPRGALVYRRRDLEAL